MRLAPVAIRYAALYPDNPAQIVRCGYESSLPTHRAPQATSAACYLALALAALIWGEPREEVSVSIGLTDTLGHGRICPEGFGSAGLVGWRNVQ
jgi:ADP-ribosylglycohydrolase